MCTVYTVYVPWEVFISNTNQRSTTTTLPCLRNIFRTQKPFTVNLKLKSFLLCRRWVLFLSDYAWKKSLNIGWLSSLVLLCSKSSKSKIFSQECETSLQSFAYNSEIYLCKIIFFGNIFYTTLENVYSLFVRILTGSMASYTVSNIFFQNSFPCSHVFQIIIIFPINI